MTNDKPTGQGKILGISGQSMSGLWQIQFSDGFIAHIESGYGARALVNCFGSLKDAIGKEVSYSTDAFGILEWFIPVNEEEI